MAKDRYKYFRIEARELLDGLSRDVLEIEKSGPSHDLIARILRLAHTLKGAARVVKQPEIAELSHSIEDIFALYRDGGGSIRKDSINRALEFLDAISNKLQLIDLSNEEAKAPAPLPASEQFETVRVEIEEVDKLLESAAEASVQITALRLEAESLQLARKQIYAFLENPALRSGRNGGSATRISSGEKSWAAIEELRSRVERVERNLKSGIDQLETEISQVRDAASRLRLVSSATIFADLERAVRDAAQSLGKKVRFESAGGELRLDGHILGAIRDALLHVVRNAVAHGIEPAGERVKIGKPPEGMIRIRVERRGSRAAFVCSDDGRGIDVEAVGRAAVQRGLAEPRDASRLGLKEAIKIILQGGVTTARGIDEVSGRGIGLDVVREIMEHLKGEVRLDSTGGSGTRVELSVPISLSSLAAVEVAANDTVLALPLDSVKEIVRISHKDIARAGRKQSILHEGKVIPFAPLNTLLTRGNATDRPKSAWSAVVLQSPNGAAAIGVDRLVRVGTVVVRPLPTLIQADPCVAGASLDGEGSPQLVLEPAELVAMASGATLATTEASSQRRPPVLVIDDSLTTRMLEQNILESAGYEVDLATSGEEGLYKAGERPYSLFLVDVEMPGIDGFEFIAKTQASAKLRDIPAVLVTSRNAPEDHLRGEQVGARGYIVKGEFDQGRLLRMIEELLEFEHAENTRIGR